MVRCQQVWMKREDSQFRFASIATPQGRVMLTFDYQRFPLGYTVQLQDFVCDPNSRSKTNAALASTVDLIDDCGTIIGQHRIAMNQPLTCGKFTFYQSNGHDADQDATTSVLTVACDPGRFLKYTGSWMICGGMLLMFVQRSCLFRSLPYPPQNPPAGAHHADSPDGESPQLSSSYIPRPLGLGRLGLGRHRESDVDQSIL